NPGAYRNDLYGVNARASNDVWAVGDTDQAGNGFKTLALHWDGSGWLQVQTPDNPTGRDHFYGVAATAGGVAWAVGIYGCSSRCRRRRPVALRPPPCRPTPPCRRAQPERTCPGRAQRRVASPSATCRRPTTSTRRCSTSTATASSPVMATAPLDPTPTPPAPR